ncbi:MAG TPA: ABC transporter permease [Candidatus Baltobacteraceae bacterium]|jgi:ABC-type dipeptide/oligopeptide/nickel transport system permease subunit|nr:ABC transporter permease [Candidatus Baltobacteraceae bacterium]
MSESPHLSPNQRAWRRFRRNRGAAIALVLLLGVVALILLWPLFNSPALAPVLPNAMTHNPDAISDAQFAPPGWAHWFGTDVHGRDLLSRVCYGARVSLLVGLVGAAVSLIIGVLWGAVAGYCGGRWDGVLMRFVDVLYSMPSVIFVIVLITGLNAVFGKLQAGPHGLSSNAARTIQFFGLFGGLGAVSWLTMARIVRGQVLSLRHRAFIDASRVLGASHTRILLRHILPNVYGVIIVYLTLTIPSIILYESFLSYLGLGIQPPQASLGSLIASGAEQINPIRIYWWLIVFPGAALALTLLALNFVGDGLRDAWDPRSDRL